MIINNHSAHPAKRDHSTSALLPPLEHDSPDVWFAYIARQYADWLERERHSSHIDLFFHQAQQQLLRPLEVWRDECAKDLYTVNTLLFLLVQIDVRYADSRQQAYFWVASFQNSADKCHQQLLQRITQLDFRHVADSYRMYGESTIHLLREYSFGARDLLSDWKQIYRALWSELGHDQTWLAEERRFIHDQLATEQLESTRGMSNAQVRDRYLHALIYFDYVAQRDEEAIARLGQFEHLELRDVIHYPMKRHDEQNDAALLRWLRALKPLMARAPKDHFHLLMRYWSDLLKSEEDETEYHQMLIDLLPRSYYYFTQYLLRTKQVRTWVNFHQMHQLSPLDIHSHDLDTVKQHDPTLLLPLYHQTIERYILQKKRESYRNAVRLLVGLRDLYAGLQQRERFETYMSIISAQSVRLRALQEELRKGKLLS